MTDENKPYIFVQFEEPGSPDYMVSINNLTSSQLFMIAGVLQFQAGQSYLKEQIEMQKEKLAEPTKGILTP